jgi:hypothetical protein
MSQARRHVLAKLTMNKDVDYQHIVGYKSIEA